MWGGVPLSAGCKEWAVRHNASSPFNNWLTEWVFKLIPQSQGQDVEPARVKWVYSLIENKFRNVEM